MLLYKSVGARLSRSIGGRGLRMMGLLAATTLSIMGITMPASAKLTRATDPGESIAPSVTVTMDNTAEFSGLSGNKVFAKSVNLNVQTDASNGYILTMQGAAASTDLINDTKNTLTIPSTDAKPNQPAALAAGHWGYALPGQTGFDADYTNPTATSKFAAVPGAGDGQTAAVVATGNTATSNAGQNISMVYGVNIDADSLAAGNYKTNIVYTATAQLPQPPTVTALSTTHADISSTNTDTGRAALSTANYTDYDTASLVTATGTNLKTATRVWIDLNDNGTWDDGEDATAVTPVSDTQLTFKTPLDTKAGAHTVHVVTQGGSTTAKSGDADIQYSYVAPSICEAGNSKNTCQVDIDANMVPVRYDTATSQWLAVNTDDSKWYNYNQKQWANAVTVQADKLSTYKNADDTFKSGTAVASDDILGYYVYIPRYDYEVMRRDATDHFVLEQDFDIRFTKVSDIKKSPMECKSNSAITTYEDMWGTDDVVRAKDYRDGCGISRTYYQSATADANAKLNQLATANAAATTWATHPAFSWTYTQDNNGLDKTVELNGFWIGKFETTGTNKAPTVKPNQHSNISETIGTQYDLAKSVGVADAKAVGGNDTTGLTQNSHNLKSYNSHLLKNVEWGAVAYLSASAYGAGVMGVQINSAYPATSADADGQDSRYGITGCGPSAKGQTSTYTDGTALNATTIESPTACSANVQRAYNGSLGQLASTTNNVYGVYDMSGGAWEYVMGNLTDTAGQTTSNTAYLKNPVKAPYVDLYPTEKAGGPFGTKPAWSKSGDLASYGYDSCSWSSCGGQALASVRLRQIAWVGGCSWGSQMCAAVTRKVSEPFTVRSGMSNQVDVAGLWFNESDAGDGLWLSAVSFRLTLAALALKIHTKSRPVRGGQAVALA